MNTLLLQAPVWMNSTKNILSEKKPTRRNASCDRISRISRAAKLMYGVRGQEHRHLGRGLMTWQGHERLRMCRQCLHLGLGAGYVGLCTLGRLSELCSCDGAS